MAKKLRMASISRCKKSPVFQNTLGGEEGAGSCSTDGTVALGRAASKMHDWRQAFLKSAALSNMRAPIGVGIVGGRRPVLACGCHSVSTGAGCARCSFGRHRRRFAECLTYIFLANQSQLGDFATYLRLFLRISPAPILAGFCLCDLTIAGRGGETPTSLPSRELHTSHSFAPCSNGCGWLAGLKTAEK